MMSVNIFIGAILERQLIVENWVVLNLGDIKKKKGFMIKNHAIKVLLVNIVLGS